MIAALATLFVHGSFVLRFGIRAAPDTATYSLWADRLITMHFDYPQYLAVTEYWNVPPVLYAGFVTLVACAKLVAGAAWQELFVALQLIADCATAAIVAALAGRFGGPTAAVASIVLFALAFDIATWVRFPLTDVLFMFATFCAYALAVAGRRRRILTMAAVVAVVALGLRPVGFLYLLATAVVIWCTSAAMDSAELAGARLTRIVRCTFMRSTPLTSAHATKLPHSDTMRRSSRWQRSPWPRTAGVAPRVL